MSCQLRPSSSAVAAGAEGEAYVFTGKLYARWNFIKDEMIEMGKIASLDLFKPLVDNLGICVID